MGSTTAQDHALAFPWLKFTFLKADPNWRRLPEAEREQARQELQAAIESFEEIDTFPYSTVGMKPESELLLWNWADSPDRIQDFLGHVRTAGLGRYLDVTHSMLGRVRQSRYVRRPTSQEQAIDVEDHERYLIVYPFTKTIDWYLMSEQARQGMMNEHIKVGKQFPSVRQVLAYSTGLDDQEFIVVYETDELVDFQDLVIALRNTEARRYTERDTPIFTCIHRPLDACLRLLG